MPNEPSHGKKLPWRNNTGLMPDFWYRFFFNAVRSGGRAGGCAGGRKKDNPAHSIAPFPKSEVKRPASLSRVLPPLLYCTCVVLLWQAHMAWNPSGTHLAIGHTGYTLVDNWAATIVGRQGLNTFKLRSLKHTRWVGSLCGVGDRQDRAGRNFFGRSDVCSTHTVST